MPRILIADDQGELRRIMAEALGDEGYVVEVASDGEEAAELLLRDGGDAVDVIVTDDDMPRLTGREMLRRVRAAGVRTPAIMASGSATVSPQERLELGIDAVLTKPVPLGELLDAVKAALGA